MILDEILEKRRLQLQEEQHKTPLAVLEKQLNLAKPPRDFLAAVMEPGISLIAEVKKASPSRGMINAHIVPGELAKTYQRGGARAISVLTERAFFRGHADYLREVKAQVSLPALRKDFIFDPYQIIESKVLGADAVLLIMAMLSDRDYRELYKLANDLGLKCLVEVHDRQELERALQVNPDIIGINNRNLKSFSVDIKTTLELLSYIPPGVAVISESGINNFTQVELLSQQGVHGILVGEALSGSADVPLALQKLLRGDG